MSRSEPSNFKVRNNNVQATNTIKHQQNKPTHKAQRFTWFDKFVYIHGGDAGIRYANKTSIQYTHTSAHNRPLKYKHKERQIISLKPIPRALFVSTNISLICFPKMSQFFIPNYLQATENIHINDPGPSCSCSYYVSPF